MAIAETESGLMTSIAVNSGHAGVSLALLRLVD